MRTLIALAIVLISTSVFAQPYIIADPQTDASVYRIRLSLDNGVTWGEWVEAQAINNAMKFNIGPINKGLYKGEAQSGAVVELTDSQTGIVSTVPSLDINLIDPNINVLEYGIIFYFEQKARQCSKHFETGEIDGKSYTNWTRCDSGPGTNSHNTAQNGDGQAPRSLESAKR